MHRGAGDEDRAFQRIGALALELIGDGGEQPVARGDALGAGIEQREAAGAVGRFHHAGLEAALPDRRRLLVAGHAENADGARRTSRSVTPKSPAQSRTSGNSARGTPNSLHRSSSQAPRADIEQRGARGIAGIGRVHLAAGQPPQQKTVDGAEGELACVGSRARAVHIVEQPGDLAGGEIRIEQQPGLGGDLRLVAGARASASQKSAVRRSCQTMALWIGLPRGAVPDDRGLALIGDADAGDVFGRRAPPWPCASRTVATVAAQISSGSCSTPPGAG